MPASGEAAGSTVVYAARPGTQRAGPNRGTAYVRVDMMRSICCVSRVPAWS